MSEVTLHRCRANMAHGRQSRPDSGLGFQVKVRETVSERRGNTLLGIQDFTLEAEARNWS